MGFGQDHITAESSTTSHDGLVALVNAKFDGMASLLDQNRESILATEARMVKLVDQVVDRLERTTGELSRLLQDQSKENKQELKELENEVEKVKSGQAIQRAFVTLAVIVMPTASGLGVWFYQQQIKLTTSEVLELRLQLDDLARHKRLGGSGSFWVGPSRRIYRPEDKPDAPPRLSIDAGAR